MSVRTSLLASSVALLFTGNVAAFDFGVPWKGYGTQCEVVKKDKKGKVTSRQKLWFTHTGLDVGAKKATTVTVKTTLYYHSTHTDSGGWKDHVIACSALKDGKCANDKNTVYYDFLHLNAAKGLKAGQSLKDVAIGTIADLGSNSHLHLSKRVGVLDLGLLYKGALPPAACTDGRKGLPSFPEKFVKPDSSIVAIK